MREIDGRNTREKKTTFAFEFVGMIAINRLRIRIVLTTILKHQLKVSNKFSFTQILHLFQLFRHGAEIHRFFYHIVVIRRFAFPHSL